MSLLHIVLRKVGPRAKIAVRRGAFIDLGIRLEHEHVLEIRIGLVGRILEIAVSLDALSSIWRSITRLLSPIRLSVMLLCSLPYLLLEYNPEWMIYATAVIAGVLTMTVVLGESPATITAYDLLCALLLLILTAPEWHSRLLAHHQECIEIAAICRGVVMVLVIKNLYRWFSQWKAAEIE